MTPLSSEAPETVIVTSHRVSCAGGEGGKGGALGHPKVWMDMGQDHTVRCKYCDRVFVLADSAKP